VGVGLFTNSTARQDFVHNGIIAAATQVQDVFIASAFFTESRTVEQIAQQGCNVRLIVRLGFPTSPGALASVSQMAPVQVRYFADSSSHTTCPWKGEASYKTIEVDGESNPDAAWYYPQPKEAAAEIKDYFAFWKGVTVEA